MLKKRKKDQYKYDWYLVLKQALKSINIGSIKIRKIINFNFPKIKNVEPVRNKILHSFGILTRI